MLPGSGKLGSRTRGRVVPLALGKIPRRLSAKFLRTITQPIRGTAKLVAGVTRFRTRARGTTSRDGITGSTGTGRAGRRGRGQRGCRGRLGGTRRLVTTKGRGSTIATLKRTQLCTGPRSRGGVSRVLRRRGGTVGQKDLFRLVRRLPTPRRLQSRPPTTATRRPRPTPRYPPRSRTSKPTNKRVPGGRRAV